MEKNKISRGFALRQCNTHLCSVDAQITCLTHKSVICNVCASIFHYDWEVSIKDGEGFIREAIETTKSLLEIVNDEAEKHRLDSIINYLHAKLSLLLQIRLS